MKVGTVVKQPARQITQPPIATYQRPRMRFSFHRLATWPTVALLAVTLTACGGTAAITPTTAPATTQATTVAMVATTAVPTSTPAPSPTVVPTLAPTSLPTATPMPTTAIPLTATDTAIPEAATTSAGEQSTGAAQAVCAILTEDEVTQVLGPLDGPPDGSITDMTGSPSCGYPARDGLLFVGSQMGDAAALQALVQQTEERGAPLQQIEGLGEAAYAAAASIPGAPNQDAVQGLLFVQQGDTIMNIALLSNIDEAKTLDALQQLAKLALARLP